MWVAFSEPTRKCIESSDADLKSISLSRMTMRLLVFYLVLIYANQITAEAYKGCFVNRAVNKTHSQSLKIYLRHPGDCCMECGQLGYPFFGVFNGSNCRCLNETRSLYAVAERFCNSRCLWKVGIFSCGGTNFTSVYHSNVTILTHATVSLENEVIPVTAQPFSILCSTKRKGLGVLPQETINVSWTVDDTPLNRTTLFSSETAINVSQAVSFLRPGKRKICAQFSNSVSFATACRILRIIGNLSSLALGKANNVNVTRNGSLVFEWRSIGKLNVSVSAGSAARFCFQFSDTRVIHKVAAKELNRDSCMTILELSHKFTTTGWVTLTVTAVNSFWNRSLAIGPFIVVGKIKAVAIETRFLLAGEKGKIMATVTGDHNDCVFTWNFAGSQKVTMTPFLTIEAPDTLPRFDVYVSAENYINNAEGYGKVYILPRIYGARLAPVRRNLTVGTVLQFLADVNKTSVPWTSADVYDWDFGDGTKMSGSVPSITYGYSGTGRFLARVRVKNFLSSVLSNIATIEVQEPITKLRVQHHPFLFGEEVRFFCTMLSGSHVRFTWRFGDGSPIKKTVAPNATHFYNRTGEYFLTLMAENFVSSEKVKLRLFVIEFNCQKPKIEILGANFKDIAHSDSLRLKIGLDVNCSVSLVPIFSWKITRLVGSSFKAVTFASLGMNPIQAAKRTLFIPPFRLLPGDYNVQIKVTMKNTIIHNSASLDLRVTPTPLKAIITGGTTQVVGERSGEIILDGSESYDPDAPNNKDELRFFWSCIAMDDYEGKDCFKESATGLQWTLSSFRFMTGMMQKPANLYIFTLIVMKDGKPENGTAAKSIIVREGSLYGLNIVCESCLNDELWTHSPLRFTGVCSQCQLKRNLIFEWKLFYNKKVVVLYDIHGKCVASDGSSWTGSNKLEETNATTVKATSSTDQPRTKPVQILIQSTDSAASKVVHDAWREFSLCDDETSRQKESFFLDVSTPNKYPDLKSLQETEFPRLTTWTSGIETKRKKKPISTGGGDTSTNSDPVKTLRNGSHPPDGTLVANAGTTLSHTTTGPSTGSVTNDVHKGPAAIVASNRKALSSNKETPLGTTPKPKPDTKDGVTYRNVKLFTFGTTTRSAGQETDLPLVGTGVPKTGRFGSGGGDLGSGNRVTGSGIPATGSGRGCSSGDTGNQRSGKGTGHASGSRCPGQKGKFGQGSAKGNNTESSGISGGKNSTTTGNSKFKDKDFYKIFHKHAELLAKIYHPVNLQSKGLTGRNRQNTIVLKGNSLIQGQIYLLEYSAYWLEEDRKRLAGQAKLYFTTGKGPLHGTCAVTPQSGTELDTWFYIVCKDWKDEHYPLRFQTKYRSSKFQDKYSIVYDGFASDVKMMLPAGDEKQNYTAELTIKVMDLRGEAVTLCPLRVQVFPKQSKGMIEEELYNMTHGEKSQLTKYQAESDLPGLISFVFAVIHKLNRQSPLNYVSSRFHLRHDIKIRLLQAIFATKIIELDERHMVLTVLRDVTKVSTRQIMLLMSSVTMVVEIAERLLTKISGIYDRSVEKYPDDFLSDFLDLVSQLLENSRMTPQRSSRSQNLASTIDRILSLQSTLVEKKLQGTDANQASFMMKTPSLVIQAGRHRNISQLYISNDGVEFVLDTKDITNKTNSSGCWESQTTLLHSNPYNLATFGGHEINTKIAGLDIQSCDGGNKVEGLSKYMRFSLRVNQSQVRPQNTHTVMWGKHNSYILNVTKSMLSRALSIQVEIKSHVASTGYSIRALFRRHPQTTPTYATRSMELQEGLSSIFVPSNSLKESGLYAVDVFIVSHRHVRKRMKAYPSYSYQLTVMWTSCLYWDKGTEFWSNRGCHPTTDSSLEAVSCRCNHLTLFAASSMLAPLELRVEKLNLFTSSEKSLLIFFLVALFTFMYIAVSLAMLVKGKGNGLPRHMLCLPENHSSDPSRYVIQVDTGHCDDAGTSARVSIILYGSEGRSSVREITCQGFEMFQRGSSCKIYSSYPNMIGDLHKIHVMHNNEGSSPSWYLKHVTIMEEASGKSWHFPCNSWLAVDRGLQKNECVLKATMESRGSPVQTICKTLLEYHLWLSLIVRPAKSAFSRLERLLLLFFVVMSYMFLTGVWIDMAEDRVRISLRNILTEKAKGLKNQETFSLLPIPSLAYFASLHAALMMLPIYLVLLYIFRHSKPMDISSFIRLIPYVRMGDGGSSLKYGSLFYDVLMRMLRGKDLQQKLDWGHEYSSDVGCYAEQCGIGCIMDKMSSIWRFLAWTFCLFVSLFFGTLTILWGMRYSEELSYLWSQAILLAVLQDFLLIQVGMVVLVSVFRCLPGGSSGPLSVTVSQEHAQRGVNVLSKTEMTEELTLMVRNRARFSRYNKPLRGRRLIKLRQSEVQKRKYALFCREFTTALLLLLTMVFGSSTFDVRQKYATEKSLHQLIHMERNGSNVIKLSSFHDVYQWLQISLPELLVWKNWYDPLQNTSKGELDTYHMFTFGPGKLAWKMKSWGGNQTRSQGIKFYPQSKEDLRYLNESRTPPKNSTQVLHSVLLGCSMELLIHQLQAIKNWMKGPFEELSLDFISLQPHLSILTWSKISFSLSDVRTITTSITMYSYVLHGTWTYNSIPLLVLRALLLLWTIFTLNKEFGRFMDHGFSYFTRCRRLLEAFLVISILTSFAFLGWFAMAVFDLSYKMSFLSYDDNDYILDMSNLSSSDQALRYTHGAFCFFATLRLLRFLRLIIPLENHVIVLRKAAKRLLQYSPVLVLVIALLSHVGMILLCPLSQAFGSVVKALVAVYGVLCRKSLPETQGSPHLDLHHPILSSIFQVIAMVIMFASWRLTAVFFLNKYAGNRKYKKWIFRKILPKCSRRLVYGFVDGFKGLFRERPWSLAYKSRRDRYFPSSIPIQYAYTEIQSQVEEMLSRVDTLFANYFPGGISNVQDGDDFSFDLAYSNFNEGFLDESCTTADDYSDSSNSLDLSQSDMEASDSDTINFSREGSSLNFCQEASSSSGVFGSEQLFYPGHQPGYNLADRVQNFRLVDAKQLRFHKVEDTWPKVFTLQSDKTFQKLTNWSPQTKSPGSEHFALRASRRSSRLSGDKPDRRNCEKVHEASPFDGNILFNEIVTKRSILRKVSEPSLKTRTQGHRLSWPRNILPKARVSPFRGPTIPATIDQLMTNKRGNSSFRNFRVFPVGSEQSFASTPIGNAGTTNGGNSLGQSN